MNNLSKIIKRTFILSLTILLLFTGCSKRQSGKDVKIPQSIVALSPASVEILFAVGAGSKVSAVSDFTDYPAAAAELPKVGGFDGKTLSMEKILSYKPDFVYLTDGMHNFLIESLEQYGINYYVSKADSIDSVEQEILEVGELVGHKKEAEAVVGKMESKLESFKNLKLNRARKPSVYYEVWNAPYMSAGASSFMNDVIETAGGKNLFDDVAEAYPIVSEETIIARNPVIILIPATSGVDASAVASRAGWKDIYAVANNQIFVIDDNVFTRPGPRIADCVETLYNLINE